MGNLSESVLILHTYRGSGKINSEGIEEDCTFQCTQYSTGDIEASCWIQKTGEIFKKVMNSFGSPTLLSCTVKGYTDEGYLFEIDDATCGGLKANFDGPAEVKIYPENFRISVASKDKSKTSKVVYSLVNLEYNGYQVREYRGKEYRLSDIPTKLSDGGLMITQVQNYKEVMKRLRDRGGVDVTAEVIFEERTDIDYNVQESILENLCLLLSLAKGTIINWVYCTSYDSNNNFLEIFARRAYTTEFQSGFGMIDTRARYKEDLKYFVEKCYDQLKVEKRRMGLDTAISYYLESKRHPAKEIKFLLASIMMETLKSNYKNIRRLAKRMDFRHVLEKLFNEYGIVDYNLDFIDLRNVVVHEGLLNISLKDFWEEYQKLIRLADETFMKILRYDGYYIEFGTWKRKKIS